MIALTKENREIKMRHRQTIFLIAIISVLLFFGCGDRTEKSAEKTGSITGENAIDFTLKDMEGRTVSLSSFNGKSVVCLVFWATWCPGCLTDIPILKKLETLYADKGLKILAVNVGANDSVERIISFKKRYETNYSILYDSDSMVTRLYGVSGIPTSIIIDKKGIIRYRGYALPPNVESVVEELL